MDIINFFEVPFVLPRLIIIVYSYYWNGHLSTVKIYSFIKISKVTDKSKNPSFDLGLNSSLCGFRESARRRFSGT